MPPTASASPARVVERVARLTTAAAKRVVEPDEEVTGSIGCGQLLPDELLSVAGLDLELSPGARATLSREEIAAITEAGIRFEAVLEAGFAAQLATAEHLTDPRWTFILHEMGEETRHQRLFQRLLADLAPTARPPLPFFVIRFAYRLAVEITAGNAATFYALVLAGEEIPDLFQKRASEHPDTDGFIRAVNRYHRAEEARHLSFARAVFPEILEKARPLDRLLLRHAAPRMISLMFSEMVHPGVYAVVGLPPFKTWRRANATPVRRQLRYDACRPVLEVVLAAGGLRVGRVPAAWRRLCGVDAAGAPLEGP